MVASEIFVIIEAYLTGLLTCSKYKYYSIDPKDNPASLDYVFNGAIKLVWISRTPNYEIYSVYSTFYSLQTLTL